ncbi:MULTISPECIES: hypothetical protein [unclassified Halomonas]|uniref:hypothetical protein n=1 Tax=unclassified Halomonas TaxID=2609666 RepID=UPI0021E44ACA|nr:MULTISPECIES: hypothetical protein [unclassified Halomonas]UYF98367.1 hypothetical protein OCT39_08945 [Halomonas sp. GD1P12]WNL40510.1 hypothetical protein RN346_08080 [Halomonas sp. PAMB 3232]WNL43840.1 hypothetical protein RN347_08040 [Halomonas sp. PAMB 3264]
MSDATPSQRIVPDVDQSLGAQHLRHRRGPRLWPLWLVLLLVIALLAALAAGLWYERERLLDEVRRVSGEVSNLHARLDSSDTDVVDSVSYMQAQMTTLFQEQEQLAVRLTNTREELYGLLTDGEDTVSLEAIDELRETLTAQREAAELNERQLKAVRSSVSALEQAGTAGRQNLLEEVASLDQNTAERVAALEERLGRERVTLDNQLIELRNDLDERLDELAEASQNAETGIDQQALERATASLNERIRALESDVRQVRQAQLAFSAQMEMLR